MNDQSEVNFVALAHFSNSVQAGMVSELLKNNGIASILQGVNFGGLEPLLMPGGYSEITLLVSESELGRAQQLYDAFFEEQADSALAEDEALPEETSQ